MAVHTAHSVRESHRIADLATVLILPRVESEGLLVYVSEEMEWFNRNVGAAELTLEQAPEVFDPVGMHRTVYVVLKMIDDLMNILFIDGHIRGMLVGVEKSASVNAAENRTGERGFAAIRHYASADLAITFQHSHYDCFAPILFAACFDFLVTGTVHVTGFAADERFVYFNFRAGAAEFNECLFLKYPPNSLQHEPCGSLRDSKRPAKLMRTDTVLAVGQHPERDHPFIEAERRILEDGFYFDRELLLAGIAEPKLARFDEGVFRRTATRTRNVAIGPAEFLGKLETAVGVGEVDYRLLQRFRFWHRVHAKTISQVHMCVN